MGQYHFQRRSERQAAHSNSSRTILAGTIPPLILSRAEADGNAFNKTRPLLRALMGVNNPIKLWIEFGLFIYTIFFIVFFLKDKVSEEAVWRGTQREDDQDLWWDNFSKVRTKLTLISNVEVGSDQNGPETIRIHTKSMDDAVTCNVTPGNVIFAMKHVLLFHWSNIWTSYDWATWQVFGLNTPLGSIKMQL